MLKRRPFNKEVRPENKKQWSEFLLSMNLQFDDLLRALNTGALVYDSGISTAAAQTITVSNLDIVSHGGYLFDLSVPRGATGVVRMFVNGDTTATNYHTDGIITTGGANTVLNSNDPAFCTFTANSNDYIEASGDIGICSYPAGNFISSWRWKSHENTNGLASRTVATRYGTAVINITSITIQGSVANTLGAGTRFRIWRRW